MTEEVVSQRTGELRKANEKFEKNSLFLSAIIDNMADGLLVTDTAGIITRLNPSLVDMLGKPEAELLNKSTGEIGFPEIGELILNCQDTEKTECV